MSTKASRFTVRSRHVAERFLQSAVVVDDQAHLDRPPRLVNKPGRQQRPRFKAETKSPKIGYGAATHDLDAKVLIDSFARLGIVCAVLKPVLASGSAANDEAPDTLRDLRVRVDKATQRADIVILDWNIDDEPEPGQYAQGLIQAILKTDESPRNSRREDHSRRLRLIAIYTGDLELESIITKIRPLLQSIQLGEVAVTKYSVSAGPVRIVVYGKGKPIIQPIDVERRVDEKVLPACLRDDFADMTQGLLSNAALESLSAIRTNTHRILRRFNRTLDPAYIAHRAMMEPPEEAEEHPVPLIASEIEGILANDRRILELVKIEAVKDWLDQLSLGAEVEIDSRTFKSFLIHLLEHGLQGAVPPEQQEWARLVKRVKKRSGAGYLTSALSGDIDGEKLDMQFAILTSLRSRYEAPPPVLRLGSIVARASEGSQDSNYLLCIQPLCDSVRLTQSRDFPFLALKARQAASGDPFDLVVRVGQQFKRLHVSRKAYDIQLISMRPDPKTKCVEAKHKNGRWEFQADVGSPVGWLADLKPEFARRILQEFIGDVARVGLTESEWLRRMAKK